MDGGDSPKLNLNPIRNLPRILRELLRPINDFIRNIQNLIKPPDALKVIRDGAGAVEHVEYGIGEGGCGGCDEVEGGEGEGDGGGVVDCSKGEHDLCLQGWSE